ncbi:hypothetical protein FB451DRAFT_1512483 [Mycena latifolia]|nr:hypothetical protein FB451DRAFT_1512483 [Mycena latifolia]
MPALFTPFPASQVVGLSAAGFFLASTMGLSPFNVIPNVERSNLPLETRAPLYGHMFSGRGRPTFAISTLGGAAAFLAAYFTRPADISADHTRALLGAAGALILAVPHTVIWMVPVYKGLADVKYSGTEVQAKANGVEERWNGLMARFYFGNSIRLLFFATAYALGIYGLASSQVSSVL